jgi:hypothetical protein
MIYGSVGFSYFLLLRTTLLLERTENKKNNDIYLNV